MPIFFNQYFSMKCCEILNIKFKLIIKQEGKNNSKLTFKSPLSANNSKP